MALELEDFYDILVAVDPSANGGQGMLLPNAEFRVYDGSDTALTHELRVFERHSGVEIPRPMRSSQFADTVQFRVEGDPVEILVVSGSFVSKRYSFYGALRQAGFDPEQVAAAVAAVSGAEAARDAAVVAQQAAEAAASGGGGETLRRENPTGSGTYPVRGTAAQTRVVWEGVVPPAASADPGGATNWVGTATMMRGVDKFHRVFTP